MSDLQRSAELSQQQRDEDVCRYTQNLIERLFHEQITSSDKGIIYASNNCYATVLESKLPAA